MKTKITLIAICYLLSAVSEIARAQGTAFTYQGRLNDGANPATGIFDLRFTIYDSANQPGTIIAGPATNSATVLSNGLFTVSLDFGAGAFTGADRWLELAVRTNGGGGFIVLTPRQSVAATPYALRALSLATNGLAGTYAGAVTLANSGNNFSGSGAGLTALNATQLASGTVPDARLAANVARTNQVWLLAGNAGTTAGAQFVGTKDNQPLELRVNGVRALRLEPNTNGAPNMIGGSPVNSVSNGVVGATIGGGGAQNSSGIGITNRVSGNYGTVSGGANNLSAAFGATVGGGDGNKATGYATTVVGGENNTASLDWATVAGGVENTASGQAAIVCGGFGNNATGDFSFAAGFGANAVHSGSFVWSSGGSFLSTAANQFTVHATGGVLFAADVQIGTGAGDYHHLTLGGGNSSGYLYGSFPYFGDGVHLGYNFYADPAGSPRLANPGGGTSRVTAAYGEVVLAVGDVGFGPNQVRLDATLTGVSVYGTFNNFSDRNAKQDFAPVSPAQILDRVSQLPVSEWSYKTDAATRHIGPTAQDFHSAFNIGTDDKHIAPIDEGGVALAAIQGLNQKLEQKETEITELKARNQSLEHRLERLENLLNPSAR